MIWVYHFCYSQYSCISHKKLGHICPQPLQSSFSQQGKANKKPRDLNHLKAFMYVRNYSGQFAYHLRIHNWAHVCRRRSSCRARWPWISFITKKVPGNHSSKTAYDNALNSRTQNQSARRTVPGTAAELVVTNAQTQHDRGGQLRGPYEKQSSDRGRALASCAESAAATDPSSCVGADREPQAVEVR